MKKIILMISLALSFASADQLIKLQITGMMCPACVSNVKSALNGTSGVKETTVFLKNGTAEVKADNSVKPEALCTTVKTAGYGCKVTK
jgi:copper chaperone CopZ